MRIAELYESLQGEGLLAGTPSSFVRTSGCNLRCHWCDTPFTSWEPTGAWRSAADVTADVLALGRRHAVITGGEPLLATDLPDLCRLLRAAGLHVTLETAGSVPSPAAADLVSISPKLASSTPAGDTPGGWAGRHAAARRRDDVLLALMQSAPYQLKFVVETMADLSEADAWIADLAAALPGGIDRGRVFLMPQGRSPDELAAITRWLAAECRARGFHLGHRHHIEWFGHTRGT